MAGQAKGSSTEGAAAARTESDAQGQRPSQAILAPAAPATHALSNLTPAVLHTYAMLRGQGTAGPDGLLPGQGQRPSQAILAPALPATHALAYSTPSVLQTYAMLRGQGTWPVGRPPGQGQRPSHATSAPAAPAKHELSNSTPAVLHTYAMLRGHGTAGPDGLLPGQGQRPSHTILAPALPATHALAYSTPSVLQTQAMLRGQGTCPTSAARRRAKPGGSGSSGVTVPSAGGKVAAEGSDYEAGSSRCSKWHLRQRVQGGGRTAGTVSSCRPTPSLLLTRRSQRLEHVGEQAAVGHLAHEREQAGTGARSRLSSAARQQRAGQAQRECRAHADASVCERRTSVRREARSTGRLEHALAGSGQAAGRRGAR